MGELGSVLDSIVGGQEHMLLLLGIVILRTCTLVARMSLGHRNIRTIDRSSCIATPRSHAAAAAAAAAAAWSVERVGKQAPVPPAPVPNEMPVRLHPTHPGRKRALPPRDAPRDVVTVSPNVPICCLGVLIKHSSCCQV